MESVFLVLLVLSLSVVWPQPGYIHPDEFFQSTEAIAGKSVSVCLSLSVRLSFSLSLSLAVCLSLSVSLSSLTKFYKAMSSVAPNFLDWKAVQY